MATRATGKDRRPRKRPAGRASNRVPPRARARGAQSAAQAAQAQLLQGVQQVWLAGMDAFARAQETVQTRVGGAREQAQETLDNLEALFQKRVERAMHQLGVPTAAEIRALSQRVAELNETVQRLDSRTRTRKAGGQRRRASAPRRRAKK